MKALEKNIYESENRGEKTPKPKPISKNVGGNGGSFYVPKKTVKKNFPTLGPFNYIYSRDFPRYVEVPFKTEVFYQAIL